ncbi:hypothetical protein [Nocardioides nanhaiensis]|uniref:Uncharacterized protein n=1 Tax=Nocardioides nanhaiensis TaxID=1476871 RepID=A0ABP8W2B1_9ACTN
MSSTASLILTAARRTLVRSTALGAGILGFYLVYDLLVPATPDADIGMGLLAFLLLVVASGLWALLDGLTRSAWPSAVAWLLTSVVVAIGWQAGLALVYSDASMGFLEYLDDPGTIVFTACLVAVPALPAVAIGAVSRRASNPAPTPQS